jgi:hypothetical protein
MIIDCRRCIRFRAELEENPDCADCVVTAIISLEPKAPAGPDPLIIEGETKSALSALSQGGLLPPLRYLPVNFR